MVAHAYTVAFQGLDARLIDVQCHLSPGLPSFTIVGLADKAVAESKERVRAALNAMGLALPAKRITINLAPADMPKEGGHYDLPIALSLLAAMEAIPLDEAARHVAMGALSLDGALSQIAGALPGTLAAAESERGFICPAVCGPEAALVGAVEVIAADSLLSLINHFNGRQALPSPEPREAEDDPAIVDLRDVRGQETAKRALEITAAGGHNLLMIGPPGAGKSMLASRLPGLLPPLSPEEALEVSMVHSIAGLIQEGRISRRRPFRSPHHSASMAAMVGGGRSAKPGEVSLAHCGVLFLDELPEFARSVLESLRQPLETGEAVVARINAHARYPARVQLIAAMNPCRCGYLADPAQACARAPQCGLDYQARISGPLLDRIDIQLETPAVSIDDLSLPPAEEGTAEVATRVAAARTRQIERSTKIDPSADNPLGRRPKMNAELDGPDLDAAATEAAITLLKRVAENLRLSARGYRRVLRVARTVADLDASESIDAPHIAEAARFRRAPLIR
ncbi:MAG: YifB family Mg chelatase-like AAA ATPase [Rhodobacteraceae bacterium]|nr:YifB family Mg chelatase-like AAA ATPase [Paracoccaceae bacterium]